MKLSPQISFRNVPESEALVNAILERVDRLDRFFPRIVGCRVVLEAPHRRHQNGNLFHVRVDLSVPGKEIVINRAPAEDSAREDAYVAIRDAFNAAKRQLEDYVRVRRGDVKTHEAPV